METFSALLAHGEGNPLMTLALCEGNLPVTSGFPSQRPMPRSFDVFFDPRLNKRLSEQSGRWWFKTPWRSWRRHGNCIALYQFNSIQFISLLSGVPDFFDRNKILSGYDLSHYQVPHCIRVFFDFVWFVFIHHNFQFYFELCTYCNILDIYLSQNLIFVNYLLFYMKLLNYSFFNMFGSVLECCELTGVSLLWPWLIKWK